MPRSSKDAPIAIMLHPHPQFGGTMNNQIVYHLYYMFAERGFSVLRFNFRGVGRSQGMFDHGAGELSDAAAALDWVQSINPEARGLLDRRLLLRRLDRHAASDAPARDRGLHLDRAAGKPLRLLVPRALPFLRPVRPRRSGPRRADQGRQGLIEKLKTQKGIVIEHAVVPGRQPLLREQGRTS